MTNTTTHGTIRSRTPVWYIDADGTSHADGFCPALGTYQGMITNRASSVDAVFCTLCALDGPAWVAAALARPSVVGTLPEEEARSLPERTGNGGPSRGATPATDKQKRYLAALARGGFYAKVAAGTLDWTDDAVEEAVEEWVATVAADVRRCSAAIDKAKAVGVAPVWDRRPVEVATLVVGDALVVPDAVEVPAGHYAIDSHGGNDLMFVRVDRPTDGKWAGRTFVKTIVGGHPDAPVARDRVAGVLARIVEAGVEAAARRYGREIGRCCVCNRTLTDDESRAAGIGPVCRLT